MVSVFPFLLIWLIVLMLILFILLYKLRYFKSQTLHLSCFYSPPHLSITLLFLHSLSPSPVLYSNMDCFGSSHHQNCRLWHFQGTQKWANGWPAAECLSWSIAPLDHLGPWSMQGASWTERGGSVWYLMQLCLCTSSPITTSLAMHFHYKTAVRKGPSLKSLERAVNATQQFWDTGVGEELRGGVIRTVHKALLCNKAF